MDVFRSAYVYVRNTSAGGTLRFQHLFTYDKDYLRSENASAVSLTLPLREEPYDSGILFPFFDGLIPEGWLLGVVSRNWKIDTTVKHGGKRPERVLENIRYDNGQEGSTKKKTDTVWLL